MKKSGAEAPEKMHAEKNGRDPVYPILFPSCTKASDHTRRAGHSDFYGNCGCDGFSPNFPLIRLTPETRSHIQFKQKESSCGNSRRKRISYVSVFNFDYLFAVVCAAGSAYSVAEIVFSALRAFGHAGHIKFPYVGTSSVASCFADFSLRYCHLSAPPCACFLIFGRVFAAAFVKVLSANGAKPLAIGLAERFCRKSH